MREHSIEEINEILISTGWMAIEEGDYVSLYDTDGNSSYKSWNKKHFNLALCFETIVDVTFKNGRDYGKMVLQTEIKNLLGV